MTRNQETEGYRRAADFLAGKGFRHLIFQNNIKEDLEKSIIDVIDVIISTIG